MLDVQAETAAGDITGGTVGDWLAIGWFTPDYRPLAEAFAANLAEHGAPFHLFAKPKLEGASRLEQILMKPAVVLEAMARHPDKAIALMDVDCIVRGDISPLAAIPGDVGVALFGGVPSKATDWRVWLGLSTRVMVFRPTEAARAFTEKWSGYVKSHGGHEERCAAQAFLASLEVRFSHIDLAYSGREVYQFPDGIVVHQSASSALKTSERGAIRQTLRNIERRFFRRGRSSRDKVAMSHVQVV